MTGIPLPRSWEYPTATGTWTMPQTITYSYAALANK